MDHFRRKLVKLRHTSFFNMGNFDENWWKLVKLRHTSFFGAWATPTKIGEIEAHFLFEHGQFPTKIADISAHLIEIELFPTKICDISAISRTSGAPDFSSDRTCPMLKRRRSMLFQCYFNVDDRCKKGRKIFFILLHFLHVRTFSRNRNTIVEMGMNRGFYRLDRLDSKQEILISSELYLSLWGLVRGCINADVCNWRLILQYFRDLKDMHTFAPIPTFAPLLTQKFSKDKTCANVSESFANVCDFFQRCHFSHQFWSRIVTNSILK